MHLRARALTGLRRALCSRLSSSSARTPSQAYTDLVGAGTIRADADQQHALVVLDRLFGRLSAPSFRDAAPDPRGAAAAAAAANAANAEKPPDAVAPHPDAGGTAPARKKVPRGVYICGEVGTGKSLLMDMLFNCVDLKRKRRVHFHGQ